MVTEPPSTITGPFVGKPAPLRRDGRLSAIIKLPADHPLWLGPEGLTTDAQADLKAHGGSERALCHYPADHFQYWDTRFPERSGAFVAGSFGENVSTAGWTEDDVAVGDVFRIGRAVVEVCQPRWPCWKLGQRFELDSLPRAVAETGRSGWLYRVLEAGEIAPNDEIQRLHHDPKGFTLATLWQLQMQARPELETLAQLAALEALASSWRKRFADRLEWLRCNT